MPKIIRIGSMVYSRVQRQSDTKPITSKEAEYLHRALLLLLDSSQLVESEKGFVKELAEDFDYPAHTPVEIYGNRT